MIFTALGVYKTLEFTVNSWLKEQEKRMRHKQQWEQQFDTINVSLNTFSRIEAPRRRATRAAAAEQAEASDGDGDGAALMSGSSFNEKKTHALVLRTLVERPLDELIKNLEGQKLFKAGKKDVTEANPFMHLSVLQDGQWAKLANIIVNFVSSQFSYSFLAADAGGAMEENEYVFGITAEENWDNDSGHTMKTRVLLIQKDSLEQLLHVNEGGVKFSSNGRHHRQRYKHLRKLAEIWQEETRIKKNSDSKGRRHPEDATPEGQPLYCGRLQLAIPTAWL